MYGLQGTSLDDPSRSYRTQLTVKAGGDLEQPLILTTTRKSSDGAEIQIVAGQPKANIIHSESFPTIAKGVRHFHFYCIWECSVKALLMAAKGLCLFKAQAVLLRFAILAYDNIYISDAVDAAVLIKIKA